MDFNVQAAMDTFRAEMQQDRIAMQQTISEGFASLGEKFSEHLDDYNETKTTVAKLDDRQKLFGKILWGVILTCLTAFCTFLVQTHAAAH